MSLFTRRITVGAAALLALSMTAACSNGDDAGADHGDDTSDLPAGAPPNEEGEGEEDEAGVPEGRGDVLEIDAEQPYTVQLADAYYDPNPPERARAMSNPQPAAADHTFLHLLLIIEGADESRQFNPPSHNGWTMEYTGCQENDTTDRSDRCTGPFPSGHGSDLFTAEEIAAGETRGIGRSGLLEPDETYYKSVWWTVAEDELPEDAELCERNIGIGESGSTGNCIPVGEIGESPIAP